MRSASALAFLLLAGSLAGCVATSDPADPEATAAPDLAGLVDPYEALAAGETSANIVGLSEWLNGGAQEAAFHGDTLFVDRGSQVFLLDISDPAAIEEVVEFDPDHSVLDVKVSDDGAFMFIGDDTGGSTPVTERGGFFVYDLADPAAPELVAELRVGPDRGPHMVSYLRMPDGREVLFGAAGPDVAIAEFDRDEGTLIELARYTPGQLAQDRHPARMGPLYNTRGWVHDMFVQVEPDGTALMYVAAWDAGLRIVDVTDPSAPAEVGMWRDFADDEEGNLHTVATDWVGDQRITIGTVEIGFGVVGGLHYAQGVEKPVLYVWDTTDLDAIELLGTWVNPVKPHAGRDMVQGEEIDSTHNFQYEQGRLYLAHYGLGAWVLDISTPETMAEPVVLAYLDEPDMNVWDVVVKDGVMYTSGAKGVRAVHYAADVLGPDGITSRA